MGDLSIKARMSKNKIGYVAPPEPKFIREMKAKLGYQYQDNLDTKLGGDAGDFEDRDDEKPTVVVMREGDLNEEEAKEEEEHIQKAEEDKMVAQGKIAFKKPTKRESSDKTAETDP